jgi:hypothetical protein
MPVADHTRASDTERERVALRLASAASVGRLTVEELEERTAAALAASTRGELSALLDDLPELPRTPGRQARRLPWLPGRTAFSARWRGPEDPRRAGADILELLVPVFARDGYVLVERTGERLVLERAVRPAWTILAAVLLFPIGLIALTYERSDLVTIDMIAHDDHTVAVAHGVAPLAIRRGLADLEFA